jgi:hypothetical protein
MVLVGPKTYRVTLQQEATARPDLAGLERLLAITDTDEVAKLRLLRALRDLGCA